MQNLRLLILSVLFGLTSTAALAQTRDYDVTVGLRALESGDFAAAVANLTEGSMQGYGIAQYHLGLMYHQGIGIEVDYERAMQLYALSAQQGLSRAQVNLALMYDRGEGTAQDYREAYYWYRQAAEQGNADGQYALGTMNFYGQGRSTDYEEAIRWYQEAARQGHRDAQFNLGVMHMNGLGTDANPVVALTWFTMAADSGSADAQYNAGLMYASGLGTERDLAAARDYLLQAAEQGMRDAEAQLGLLFVSADTEELSRDYEQARFWFNRAAHRGDALSQFYLGRIFAEGLGIERNLAIGHMWYEVSYHFGYQQALSYMEPLHEEMDEEVFNQARFMAVRWMTAYARENPGTVRLVRVDPETGEPADEPAEDAPSP